MRGRCYSLRIIPLTRPPGTLSRKGRGKKRARLRGKDLPQGAREKESTPTRQRSPARGEEKREHAYAPKISRKGRGMRQVSYNKKSPRTITQLSAPLSSSRSVGMRDIRGAIRDLAAPIPRIETLRGAGAWRYILTNKHNKKPRSYERGFVSPASLVTPQCFCAGYSEAKQGKTKNPRR